MVYGTTWSEETTHVCRLLAQWGVPYHYIDIEQYPHAYEKVVRWNLGESSIPAVSLGVLESPRLITPTDAELHGMLYTSECVRVGPLLL
jgi:hypothetical protein